MDSLNSMSSIIELNARVVTSVVWWLLTLFILGCITIWCLRYLIKRIWPRRA